MGPNAIESAGLAAALVLLVCAQVAPGEWARENNEEAPPTRRMISDSHQELFMQDGLWWPRVGPALEDAPRRFEFGPRRRRQSAAEGSEPAWPWPPQHQPHRNHHHNNQGAGGLQREQTNYKTVTTCEGNLMELNCDEGRTIHLMRAIYGRFSLSICNEMGHSNYSVQCASFKSFLVLETRCNRLTSCNVTVSRDIFGEPCEGTAKYLEVQYNCVEGGGGGNLANNRQQVAPATANSVISNPNTRPQLQAAPQAHSSGGHKSHTPQQAISNNVVGGEHPSTGGTIQLAGDQNNALADRQQQQQNAQQTTTTTSGNNLDNLERQQQQHESVILQQQQQQQQAQFCLPQTSARNLYWNFTRAGQLARQACPEGSTGSRPVTWLCDPERLRFVPQFAPDFSQCRSNWLTRLGQQLDQMLDQSPGQPSKQQSFSARQQDEQMIKSILGELNLLAKTKELFSEDLKRIDIMISQMIAQLRSFSVLSGGLSSSGAPPPSWLARSTSGGQQAQQLVALNPLVSTFRELFSELTSICSNLFDGLQRQAWLELPTNEARRRLEMRFLGHMREAGLLLAQSLTHDQLAEVQPIRQANVLATLSVLPFAGNQLRPSANSLDSLADFGSMANKLFDANAEALARFPGPQSAASPLGWQDDAELRLPAQLLSALAANGFTKFLVLDVKKLDFSLLRMQLEQQQQQQQVAGAAGFEQAALLDNQQQQNLAMDQTQLQRRLFGVFAVHGETGELLGGAEAVAATGGAATPAPPQQDSIKRLADLMAQWPISIEFKSSSPSSAWSSSSGQTTTTTTQVAGSSSGSPASQRQCQSLSSDISSQDLAQSGGPSRCRLSSFNATNFVCSCDRFGFVALGAQLNQQVAAGAQPPSNGFLNDAGQQPQFPWAAGPSPYDPLGLSPTGLEQDGRAFGGQAADQTSGSAFVVNKQQQPQQQAASLGLMAYIFIVICVGLMILSLSGLLVNVLLRLRSHARLSKKHQQHQSFLNSWRSSASGGPTTGPLAADHNLMGSDPLVSGTTRSASIMGLASGHHHQPAAYKTHQQHHQLYAAHPHAGHSPLPGGPMLEAYAAPGRSRRAWPARLLGWLLERPAASGRGGVGAWAWLSSSSAASSSGASSADAKAAAAAVSSAGRTVIQHRIIGGSGSGGTFGTATAAAAAAAAAYPKSPFQNGYTTSLGLHAHHNQTLARQAQHHLSSAGSGQSAMPLNNSSSSSYVSSSAYYEEIGPGNMTKVNASQLNGPSRMADPFQLKGQQNQRNQHSFQVDQLNQQSHQWQAQLQGQTISYSPPQATSFGQQQQQQQHHPAATMSLITKQHLHNDLSPLQSSSSSSAGSQQASSNGAQPNGSQALTPRHYLFASPIAVNAYKQQQFRGH